MATATTVPVLFAAATVVAGTAGLLMLGAARVNCHSHREHRKSSAARGTKRAGK